MRADKLAWPLGLVLSHEGDEVWVVGFLGASADGVFPLWTAASAHSSTTTPAIPRALHVAPPIGLLDGVLRPTHAAHRIRAA